MCTASDVQCTCNTWLLNADTASFSNEELRTLQDMYVDIDSLTALYLLLCSLSLVYSRSIVLKLRFFPLAVTEHAI